MEVLGRKTSWELTASESGSASHNNTMTGSDLDLSDNDSIDGRFNPFDAREFIEKQLELLEIENEVNTEM